MHDELKQIETDGLVSMVEAAQKHGVTIERVKYAVRKTGLSPVVASGPHRKHLYDADLISMAINGIGEYSTANNPVPIAAVQLCKKPEEIRRVLRRVNVNPRTVDDVKDAFAQWESRKHIPVSDGDEIHCRKDVWRVSGRELVRDRGVGVESWKTTIRAPHEIKSVATNMLRTLGARSVYRNGNAVWTCKKVSKESAK